MCTIAMLIYTLGMYTPLENSLANPWAFALIIICCGFSTLSIAQEADKAATDSNTASEVAAPIRVPGSQQRSQFPSNNGSDNGHMAALGEQLSNQLKEATVWLETSSNERFLSLWQPDRSGNPRGALLIIHSEGEHPAWPNTTNPLHETLPDYGWATMALSLPEPAQATPPERTLAVKTAPAAKMDGQEDNSSKNTGKSEGAQSTEEEPKTMAEKPSTDSTTKTVSPEAITEQRLETALRFLHGQGQFNIVILGNGTGAIRANTFLNNNTPKTEDPSLANAKPFRAIVLLNGRNRLPTMEQDYKNWFSDPSIPVLDIYVGKDPRNQQAAKARKVLAKQKKVAVYKQVKLSHLTHTRDGRENILSRRIRSYLSANATGVEADALKTTALNE